MILLLDTTTNVACIGLWNGKKLKTKIIESNSSNNRKLVSIIKKFICDLGFDICDLRAVGLVNGPGSFTGVRTGVVIANTIAYALKIPIYATDTLTAQIPVGATGSVAPGRANGSPLQKTANIVSLLPASHTELYLAEFKNGKMIGKIKMVKKEEIENNNSATCLAGSPRFRVGAGCEAGRRVQQFSNISPKIRLKNLLQMILNNKTRPTKQALPLYIKKPNITRPRSISWRNR